MGTRVFRGLVHNSNHKLSKSGHAPDPRSWPANGITAAWLGHSTVLVNFYGVTILTDPVLFGRVGLNIRLGTIGPKRLVAPALNVHELPPIDLVLLSHAHMDHFDMTTLRCLSASTQAVTAHHTIDLLARTRLRKAHELPWGKKAVFKTAHGNAEVTSFAVKHWGARWRRDSYRGYAGYVVAREGKKIIFGGDTAYTDNFRTLKQHGPYEMAIMPIGAYQPWECSHCTPEQAVKMANLAGAKYLLPIHHKTFRLGREGPVQPMQRLREALEPERIGWHEVGQTFACPA